MSTIDLETADREPAVLNLKPLQLGPLTIDVPVVLAPMAGVTNKSFRKLCREYGGGLYVTEMVTARALVERRPESLRIIHHDPDETPRSIQIYGVDAVNVGKAVRMVAQEDRADHIDLNFGCPVPKVTKRGGGSALPWKTDLFRAIIRTAVQEASEANIPVTIKMRIGIDDEHQTYLDAGRMARDEGVAAVALHGRTLQQHYSGTADWDSIARLREALPDIPVLGNGDIFSAEDAVHMVEQTGVDGVVVGRGCQGRPWLFGDLQAAFEGSPKRYKPGVRKVAETIYRHAELLAEEFGDEAKAAAKSVSTCLVLQGLPGGRRTSCADGAGAQPGATARTARPARPGPALPRQGCGGPSRSRGQPSQAAPPGRLAELPHPGDAERLGLVHAELDVSGG